VLDAQDYYPFGMMMPGRKFSANIIYGGANAPQRYRYTFNSMERADEIASGDVDYGARIYDSKIGRWLSLDPLMKKYPAQSAYNFVQNSPIVYKDVDGRDIWLTIYVDNQMTGKKETMVIKINDSDSEIKSQFRRTYTNDATLYVDEYVWYDRNFVTTMTINKDGKTSFSTPVEQGVGPQRTETNVDSKSWAVFKLALTPEKHKERDIGEGYYLSSKKGGGYNDPFLPGAEKINIIDGEGLLMLIGNWREFGEGSKLELATLAETLAEKLGAIKELGAGIEAADFLDRMDNYFDGLTSIMDAIDEVIDKNESKKQIKGKYYGFRQGSILHTLNGNVLVDSDSTGTCCQDDKRASDTLPEAKKSPSIKRQKSVKL
jgi:RHS repeat-associated protein